ncbi:hypothetical protein ACHAXS_012304 [Conticribra weissflogii]
MRFRVAYIATSSLSSSTISNVPPLPKLEPPHQTNTLTDIDTNHPSTASATPAFASSFDQDTIFNEWCNQMGIHCPHAAVRTGPESVAGRGVFATSNVKEGEVVISIPYELALTQDNAARFFPELEEELLHRRRRIANASGVTAMENEKVDSFVERIWNRLVRRKTNSPSTNANTEDFNPDDFWQAELTAYALAALDSDHPWGPWISQWRRDDPLQTLVDRQRDNVSIEGEGRARPGPGDEEVAIRESVDKFHEMAPQIPKYKINAAVHIRLHQLDQYIQNYQIAISSSDRIIPTSKSMYTTLISRAIGLSNTITACLPMHDMINHSNEPNLGFTFCDGNFEMVALRDIGAGEEFFLNYMDLGRAEEKEDGKSVRVAEWDEDKATWLLAQWGIPSSPDNKEEQVVVGLEKLESLPIL